MENYSLKYYKVKKKKYSTFRIFQCFLNGIFIVAIIVLYYKNNNLYEYIRVMENNVKTLVNGMDTLSDSVLNLINDKKIKK